MKYKVGDKVRVLSIDDSDEDEEKRFLNKIKTIVNIWEDNEEGYIYGLENENWANLYFKETQLEDMNRDYVIVCMRHKGLINNALLFWGEYTDDYSKRSFGGYTVDITKCEKYTLNEVEDNGFKVQGIDFEGHIPKSMDDCAIRVDELIKLGYRQFTIIV